MNCNYIYSAICSMIAGIIIGLHEIKKPVRLTEKNSNITRFIVISILFFSTSVIIGFSLFINLVCNKKRVDEVGINMVLLRIIFSGILIPIIAYIQSRVFEKNIESYNLDLDKNYDKRTFKLIYSTAIISSLIVIYSIIVRSGLEEKMTQEWTVVIDWILVWVALLFGIWVEIGNVCDGRPITEKGTIAKEKERNEYGKTEGCICRKYYIFIIIVLIIDSSLLGLITVDRLNNLIQYGIPSLALGFAFGSVLSVELYSRIYIPSQKISRRRFHQYYANPNKKENGYFEGVRYKICSDRTLIIYPRQCNYDENELLSDEIAQVKELFEEEVNLDNVKPEEMVLKLQKYNTERRNLIKTLKDNIADRKLNSMVYDE